MLNEKLIMLFMLEDGDLLSFVNIFSKWKRSGCMRLGNYVLPSVKNPSAHIVSFYQVQEFFFLFFFLTREVITSHLREKHMKNKKYFILSGPQGLLQEAGA